MGIKRIGQHPPVRHHVALLYSADSMLCRLSHLEDDNKFTDSPWDWDYLWIAAEALDEFDQSATVAFLINLYKAKPAIPYGFRSAGCRFATNQLTGSLEFTAKDPGCGLTCFIVHLRRVSIALDTVLGRRDLAIRSPRSAAWRASHIVDWLRIKLPPDRYQAVIKGVADPRVRQRNGGRVYPNQLAGEI